MRLVGRIRWKVERAHGHPAFRSEACVYRHHGKRKFRQNFQCWHRRLAARGQGVCADRKEPAGQINGYEWSG